MIYFNLLKVVFLLFLVNKINGDEIEEIVPISDDIADEWNSKPNLESGRSLKNWNPNEMSSNPEEQGNYLQGDIIVKRGRNGLIDSRKYWLNNIVPYEIRGNFNSQQRDLIQRAITSFHQNTCLRFKLRTNERDYISIVSANTGCWSYVGRIGGRQEVNLQIPGCVYVIGTTIHELMHAIGFFHEHTSYDRDNFVSIMWNNIMQNTQNNFVMDRKGETSNFNVGYDYGSVLHYSASAFSKNGQRTIVPKRAVNIGQRNGFSSSDIKKINAMYKCNAKNIISKDIV